VKQRKPTNKRRLVSIVAGACLLATASGSAVLADGHGHSNGGGGSNSQGGNGNSQGGDGNSQGENGGNGNQFQHVLLLSIDGMHALDFLNCSANGTCPNLKTLATTGVNYLDTSTSKPSDSFPGLMAIVTGGSPRTVGAYYDVAFDRALAPPTITTGNGLPGGTCTPNVFPGTTTEYEEGIDLDQSQLNGGGTDGQANAIDPMKLVRDPANNCNPVFPFNFVRTNTVFGVIHKAGMRTAWSDKHAAYIAVSGPGDGTNIDDFYSPEINSDSANYASQAPPVSFMTCKPLPDQNAVMMDDDYTGSFQNIQCYDALKVQAILNEIDGKTHTGTGSAPMPNILGMNFQAVSIGQKLIYQDAATVPSPYTIHGGYTDSIGTPSGSLLQEIKFVDNSIGLMVAELKAQHQLDSTLIIVTAKHGQSPIDTSRYKANGKPNDPASILASFLAPSEKSKIGPTEDDVALLWLENSTDTPMAVSELETMSPTSNNIAGIGEIFSGPSIGLFYNIGDSRTPDIVVTPNIGVTYSNSVAKEAEHGGFAKDDINVMMLLSNPWFSAKTVTSPVETAQIAPTILKALGLNPNSLQSVQMEHTQLLPEVPLSSND
jgi:hypothetical protein